MGVLRVRGKMVHFTKADILFGFPFVLDTMLLSYVSEAQKADLQSRAS